MNQSVTSKRLLEGIFAGAGFKIVVILLDFAYSKTFSVTSRGISNCPIIAFKSPIFFTASTASSPLIKSLAPETTIILFCPELSTHIGATPLDPGTL